MGLCYTERGLGTFVARDPGIIAGIRQDMADRLTRDFVREMNEIGFTPKEMLEAIKEEIESCNV